MKALILGATMLVSCSFPTYTIARQDIPAQCLVPTFTADQCYNETLNDGTGVDDHRRVCVNDSEQWILYPSGETWHVELSDGGTNRVICHLGSNENVLWSDKGVEQ